VASSFCSSRFAGTRTYESNPAAAAWAATALARLPVEAQATVSKPSSRAFATATATTLSLKEWVGLAASFLTQTSASRPSRSARRSARSNGVKPGSSGSFGLPVKGRKSAYRQIPCEPAWIRRFASAASSPEWS